MTNEKQIKEFCIQNANLKKKHENVRIFKNDKLLCNKMKLVESLKRFNEV